MLGALTDASRAAGLGGNIAAEARDLERAPLSTSELVGLDGAILDPPRAGARSQALALAASAVPRIVMVSCHAPSLARDLRILVDGGYRAAARAADRRLHVVRAGSRRSRRWRAREADRHIVRQALIRPHGSFT